jgi:hypothetical protein
MQDSCDTGLVCTTTNLCGEPVCGDGVVNVAGEECDGSDGITGAEACVPA